MRSIFFDSFPYFIGYLIHYAYDYVTQISIHKIPAALRLSCTLAPSMLQLSLQPCRNVYFLVAIRYNRLICFIRKLPEIRV